MHQVIYTIRHIPPDELPTHAELVNLGIVPLGHDLYSCVHQIRRDPVTLEWSKDPHPGVVLTQGSHKERHARLPADLRHKIMHKHVKRGQNHHLLPPGTDPQPGDELLGEVAPHSWHGESPH